ncbi:S24 family peptidase [Ramlibacter sp. AN1015]|uniref:S24 family peptidase n=1 Tax=Ramlibacter sp. AN1015 TaxID=3133428 RepID=UPI0030BFD700
MKTVGETRRDNLVLLSDGAGSQAALNDALGRPRADATLSQVFNRSPDSKTGKPRNMGGVLARQIEQALQLPIGWMDAPQQGPIKFDPATKKPVLPVNPLPSHTLEFAGVVSSGGHVPVVGTAKMGEDGFYEEISSIPGAGDGHLEHTSRDPHAYALRVRGDSMHPAIRDGSYVVIEPSGQLVPGEYVLVKLRSGQKMVKELLIERTDSIEIVSVNGGTRRTIYREELDSVQPVAAIFSRSKWKPD